MNRLNRFTRFLTFLMLKRFFVQLLRNYMRMYKTDIYTNYEEIYFFCYKFFYKFTSLFL